MEEIAICQLDHTLWSFPCSTEIRNICSKFAILFNEQHPSGIVAKVWDSICPDAVMSLTALTVEVWPSFISQLHRVAVNLITLNISCADAAHLLNSQMADCELHCLECALHECCIIERSEAFQPVEVKQKLLLWEDLKSVEKEAEYLVQLKDNIGLTGDFHSVVNISQVCNFSYHHTHVVNAYLAWLCFSLCIVQCSSVLYQQPLRCLDGSFRKVVDFLKQLRSQEYFSILQTCLFGMRNSPELMQWLRDEVKGD